MNNVKLDKDIFKNIKEARQNFIVLENDNLKDEEIITIQNENTNDVIYACITAKRTFNTIEDAFRVIHSKLFGDITLYKNLKNKITIYRIKVDIDVDVKNIIKDKKILEIIDIDEIEEIKIGRSTSKVFKTKMRKNNEDIILKVQYLPSRASLKKEYERLIWLEGKINSPKVYYWSEKDEYKYLIMEYKKGIPAFKYSDIGYQLGKELKKNHTINIDDCVFDNNSVEILLNNCLRKVDIIFPEIKKKYKEGTVESTIKFLKENMPKDKVLIHGDFSLPNILIDNNIYNFIDFGDLSISTRYFDIYYFLRSLKINKKEYMIDDFMKGYGIEKLEDNYIKWMDIIDKSIY